MTDFKKLLKEKIKSEVQDLHELLKVLFSKLDTIQKIEYTHGPDEKGADFVLLQENRLLGTDNYIGVVAKIGKIHQDYKDIERQIDECFLLTRLFGVKNEIRIREVWVIVTENITNNAKEKINKQYANKKVEFIDGDKLIELINKHMDDFWYKLPTTCGNYLSKVNEEIREIENNNKLIQTDSDFYIEQDVFEIKEFDPIAKRRRFSSKDKKVDIFEEINNKSMMLIEGGMGTGKSKLLREIVKYFAQPDIFLTYKLIPLFIDFKTFMEIYKGNVDILIKDKIPFDIKQWDQSAKVLLLIDAMDEKSLSTDESISVINNTLKVENDFEIKCVFTSRYFSDSLGNEYFDSKISKYELRPLSLNKTIKFLEKLCNSLSLQERIIEDLKSSKLFDDLPKSPISALLLAKLINQNEQDMPSNLPELYSKYTEYVLGRWDMDKGLQKEKEYRSIDNILMQIAEFMLQNELNAISIDDAKSYFKNYLSERNLGLHYNLLFDKVKDRCEIIDINEKKNTFNFKHRSFVEFFYAKKVIEKEDYTIIQKSFDLYWSNSIYFLLGIKKDCPKLLKKIIDLEPKDTFERFFKIVQMSNYLLAGFLTPYDIIEEGVEKVFKDMSKFYLDIKGNDIITPFRFLPSMMVLYYMQYLVRKEYSYAYFKEAIENIALKLNYDDNNEVYVVFFLSIVYLKLEKEKPFDFFSKIDQDQIPIDIRMFIHNLLNDNHDLNTKLLRKIDKKTKKLVQNNNGCNPKSSPRKYLI